MRIAILGFAREGKSVLKFLQNRGLTRMGTRIDADKKEIWILDKNRQKVPRGVRVRFGKNYLKNLERFDVVFRSPGVPYSLPELAGAHKKGVKFSSATKLFFEQLRGFAQTKSKLVRKKTTKHPNPLITNHYPLVIGITGTKGKGTTATLLYKILRANWTNSGQAARNVFLAGNIGKPSLDILSKARINAEVDADKRGKSIGINRRRSAIVILELSSFQLQDLKISPHIAVILDIFPDHQDKHLSLAEYYAAKANIAKYQKKNDKIFFFNNKLSSWAAHQGRAKKISVNDKNFKLFEPEDLKILGQHNFKNAVMAATIAQELGVSEKIIVKTIKNFRGLPHRFQLVRTITSKTENPHSHILKNMRMRFYNDSAAVNPGATVAALKALAGRGSWVMGQKSRIILIAGGLERSLDYSELAKTVKKYAKTVVLFGENKKKIAKAVSGQGSGVKGQGGSEIFFAKTLKEAVKVSHGLAKRYSQHSHNNSYHSHYVILFSPASASFDMFKNYEERGKEFVKIVKKIR